MSRREKNQQAIRKWILVVQPSLERQTGGATLNLQEMDTKPDSEPPMNDRALDLIDHPDNRRAAKFIPPAIDWLGKNYARLHYVTRLAVRDSGAERRWRARGNPDSEFVSEMFEEAVRAIEDRIEQTYTGKEPLHLHVAVHPDDETADSRMHARDQARRRGVEDAYEDIAALVRQRIEQNYSKTAAVHDVAETEDAAPSRVWRAVKHVEFREAQEEKSA